MGADDFKHKKMPFFAGKPGNINVSMSAGSKLALVPASRYYKLNKVPPFARKSVNTNVSLSAAPKLALVPAGRHYCNVNWSYLNVCAKVH